MIFCILEILNNFFTGKKAVESLYCQHKVMGHTEELPFVKAGPWLQQKVVGVLMLSSPELAGIGTPSLGSPEVDTDRN